MDAAVVGDSKRFRFMNSSVLYQAASASRLAVACWAGNMDTALPGGPRLKQDVLQQLH